MSDARERALAKLLEPIPGREANQPTLARPCEPVAPPLGTVAAAEPLEAATRQDRAGADEPGPVEQTVLDAVAAAEWLEESDVAAVAVARRIARDLDRLPAGDSSVATLSRSLTSVLTSLQLTPAGRRQASSSPTNDPAAPVDPLARLRAAGAAARLAEQASA